ncbi:MAG: 50S ribosomal protein L4 [Candidatus Aminicenantes bacterium RBG_13_62_12]|nr:MAG: 50S ribosomal protein L4 [Candidatus Aminicenantes bacterium RBG_13_62_12]
MDKVQVIDANGQKTGEVALPAAVFRYPVKEHLLYEAAVNALANRRRGTAATKTRGMVSGGGRKPWKQKGTGRARAGSNRSPLWRKGGTVFGPQPRDFGYDLPKQARRNALRSALSLKASEKQLLILDKIELREAKTKEAAKLLRGLQLDSALIVDRSSNRNLFRAVRNIPGSRVLEPKELTAYDVLKHTWLVFTEPAFDTLMERLK